MTENNHHNTGQDPDTLNGLTIHQWRDRALDAEARTAQLKGTIKEKDEALARRNTRIWELETSASHLNPAEHIQAAWDKAHPVPVGATIPAGTPILDRDVEGTSYCPGGFGRPLAIGANSEVEYRTLTPLPAPNIEQKKLNDITTIVSDELGLHLEPWIAADLANKITNLLKEQK